LIEDWLKDREQRVVLNEKHKKWGAQGSVLSPLLFLIYIYDIANSVCYNLLKFADDTKVSSVVSDMIEFNILQRNLHNLCKWSQDWLMHFNGFKYRLDKFLHRTQLARTIVVGAVFQCTPDGQLLISFYSY